MLLYIKPSLNESRSSNFIIEYDKSFTPKVIKEKKNGFIDNTDLMNLYSNSITNDEETIFREANQYCNNKEINDNSYDPFSRREETMSPHFNVREENIKLSLRANNESQFTSYTPIQRKKGIVCLFRLF